MDVPELHPAGDFWELHRQLAKCYQADIARLRGAEEEEFLRRESSVPPLTDPSLQSVSPRTRHMEDSGARRNSRRSTIKNRREKSLKTLLGWQGVKPPAATEEEVSATVVELTCHDCWGATSSKPPVKWTRGRTKDFAAAATARPNAAPMKPTVNSAESADVAPRTWILHPGGSFRTVWNLLMAACVFYDLLVIPLYAFTLPRSVLWDVLDWLIQIYWNLDFAVSFLTGFYDEGTLVFSLLRIAMHYAKTWMLFDLSLISMDWAFRAMEWSNESELQNIMWSRSLRMLRFLRLMRMLRMVKLRRINEVFQEFFTSQASTLYYSLFSSLIHLCVLNHLVACAWFAVSHVHSENWVTDLGLQDDSMEYQYLTCLNWAFAQLGVGSSPAKATNVVEMAYCIFVAFRSLITSSTLISTVSNLMAGLSKIKEDENTEFRLLRCYMSQNNISAQLAQKITHFLQYQYTLRQQARSADMDVPLLELLSPQLHGELQFARFEKELCKLQVVHDLVFEGADRQVVHILQRVSQDAVKNNVVAAADVIFLAGNHAASAYLKLSGDLTYCYEDGEEEVGSGFWSAEVALWTPWVYLGDLVSTDVSRVASLDVQSFCHAMMDSWQTQRCASRYASKFLAAMAKQKKWSDLFVLDQEQRPHQHLKDEQTRSAWSACCMCWSSRKVQDFHGIPPRSNGR